MKDIFNKEILKNKVCLVTGGRTGIGYEIVKSLLDHGAYVIVFGRKLSLLNKRFSMRSDFNKRLFVYGCDITDFELAKDTVQDIVKKLKKIDVLINNSSVNFEIPAEKLMPNILELSVASNLTSHFYLTILVGRQMIKQRGYKRIINISAYAGGKAYPGLSHMHVCKAGLDALTKTLAIEWGRYQILVNGISPGPILTKNFMHAHTRLFRLANGRSSKSIFDEIKENELPLRRFINEIDIANMILYLCSEASSNITGQVIAVDGGAGISNSYFLRLLKNLESQQIVRDSR